MYYRLFYFISLACCLSSCKPKIFSFDATPRIVTARDSVHLQWKTSGKAEMTYYRERIARPPSDSADILDFVLVARKWGKTSAPFKQQVELVAEQSRDALSFSVTGLEGDTLIATGTKDSMLYKGFSIVSIASISNRTITVIHGGVSAVLPGSGSPVTALQGLPYSGAWILKTAITPEEKNNRSLIPNVLKALTIIKPIKN